MELTLNHQQRLNLVAVLGSLDIRGREAHAIWHLQDAIDLNAGEKQAINFEQQMMNGAPVQTWNPNADLPARTFDLTADDLERIRKALEDFPNFKAARDRFWLEPLLAQFPSATPNGNAKSVTQNA